MRQFLFLFLTLFCLQNISAKNFYGIILADIEDPAIGVACENDAIKMDSEFKKFAFHNNSLLVVEKFVGKDFSKQKLITYLSEIKPQKEDVIFIYYSGHGKYIQGIGKVLNFDDEDLKLKEIEEILETKESELKFVVTDCCSQRIPMSFAMPPRVNNMESVEDFGEKGIAIRQRNYQRLLNYEGMLIVESSQPGQYSYADDKGGIFTKFFLQAIRDNVDNGESTWKQILDKTREDVENFVGDNLEKNQIPVCDDTNLYQKLQFGTDSNVKPSDNNYLRVRN